MLKNIISFLAIGLALSVVLNGIHVKDIMALDRQEDQHISKLSSELHNHVDKAGKSLLNMAADNLLADSRSLRLRESKKRPHLIAKWLARYNLLAFDWRA